MLDLVGQTFITLKVISLVFHLRLVRTLAREQRDHVALIVIALVNCNLG